MNGKDALRMRRGEFAINSGEFGTEVWRHLLIFISLERGGYLQAFTASVSLGRSP
jgi:hypothetical protein